MFTVVLSWAGAFHNTLDASNCIEVLKKAIAKYGAPEIINSDQGRQFTCLEWKETCAEHPEMRISMDGRSRAKDNIWIERFWRTIKYDYIHIRPEEKALRFIKESFDSSMTTTITVIIRESTDRYQASSTYGRLLDIN